MSTQIDPERDRNFISLQSRPQIEKARRMDSSHMEKITVDSPIHFGKPCIAGTRIPVQSILELLDRGLSFTEIIRDYYPDLQIEDIRACLQ